MKISSQLLLTFLLNSIWQIALIAGLAALGSWLLRKSFARYRHLVWVSALCLALAVPLVTSLRTLGAAQSPANTIPQVSIIPALSFSAETTETFSPRSSIEPAAFQLNQTVGWVLLSLYFGFLLFRLFKLVQAWHNTRKIRRLSVELEPDDRVAEVIRTCEREIAT